MTRRARFLGVLFLAGMAVVPVAAHWARRGGPARCEFDGAVIEPAYRVRVVDADGRDRLFCSVTCAERWLRRSPKTPRAVFVTDDPTGTVIDAREAVFVRSLVVTGQTSGTRIHAFRTRADAEKHAAFAVGRILDRDDRPFAGLLP
jgi:ribosomal protein L24E